MGKKTPKPPPAPDPYQTAAAQLGLNEQTALAQGAMNRINEVTPYGSVTYSANAPPPTAAPAPAPAPVARPFALSPTSMAPMMGSPGGGRGGYNWATGQYGGGGMQGPARAPAPMPAPGVPSGGTNYAATPAMYTRTTTLNPLEQQLLDKERGGALKLADTATGLLGRIDETVRAPTDINSIQEGLMSRLEPGFERDRASLTNELINRGFAPGTEAYDTAFDEFNRGKTDARTAKLSEAVQLATALRAMPINEYGALMSQGQVTSPQVGAPPQVGVAAPDFQGAEQNAYQARLRAYEDQQRNRNSSLGALFGLGGSIASAGLGAGGFLRG